jgi:zinc protease
MKRFFTLAALVAGLAIGAPSLAQTPAQPPTAAANPPVPSAASSVTRFTLPNGMTVIVKPDRRAPTAVHMLWVRVGAMDEVDGTSGVAHVLEHMMFKGTPELDTGRVLAPGGGAGWARERVHLDGTATGYYQQIPADRLEEVMQLEADRFAQQPVGPTTEFRHARSRWSRKSGACAPRTTRAPCCTRTSTPCALSGLILPAPGGRLDERSGRDDAG